jgi:glycosyltransferase involved in cell wall biosynthesis
MQRAFINEAHLDVLHVEVPPVGGHGETPTVFSLHDLRSFHKPLRSLSSTAGLYERLHIRSDLKNADLTVTLSESTRRDIHAFGSRSASVRILPPPVDPPPTSSPPRPESLSDSNPFVLALGHLEPRKNLEVLVNAAASPLWPAATTLVLAGADHGSEAELRTLAARHAVDVVFTGPVSDDEKWALLSHARIVAVPSLIEGFGIVAVEAALASTPVLVSDRTSLPEIFNMPEIEIPATDPEAWAALVGRAISDPQWADATAAEQKLAAADYRLDAIAARLMGLYRQLNTADQLS